MVCEHNHGCAPLPVGDDVIAAIQRADPRPLPTSPTTRPPARGGPVPLATRGRAGVLPSAR
jgi:hypothetical protein